MRNSDAKKVKTCKSCGNELKTKSSSNICYNCLCTIEFVKKGVEHCPSKKAVIAEKQIYNFGFGWLDSLMNRSRK